MSKLTFSSTSAVALKGASIQVFAAPQAFFAKNWLGQIDGAKLPKNVLAAAKAAEPGTSAKIIKSLLSDDGKSSCVICVLPDSVSRHNSPSRADAIRAAMGSAGIAGENNVAVVLGLDEDDQYLAAANAVGAKLPLFTRKGGMKATAGSVKIAAVGKDGKAITPSKIVKETVAAGRWAASMVDTHPEEMTTAILAREAKKLVKGLADVKVSEIVGPDLLKKNLGGVHAVGRAASVAPRMLIMKYQPKGAKKTWSLVGKGVIFDTGGLSLKIGGNMCSMKGDMGGGAAVIGAFRALASTGFKDAVVALIPMAENAIGPKAYRNDDIITMHSGKTVEINNTDAEGRILLADAVSYAARVIKPSVIVDAATLTGAQLIATGLRHAGIVSNREGVETRVVETGRACGDLAHALPFAPEFYQAEFASKCADMKNSVANRANAQSSCAAQFIYSHIEDINPAWLHIDLAGPAWREGRGTGFGVALMSQLLRSLKTGDLK
ncbi:MAG: putative aminopeptidase NPEPL1 [Planctomycetota bacterium]|jgi:probable aminopeptidase NPEPL1